MFNELGHSKILLLTGIILGSLSLLTLADIKNRNVFDFVKNTEVNETIQKHIHDYGTGKLSSDAAMSRISSEIANVNQNQHILTKESVTLILILLVMAVIVLAVTLYTLSHKEKSLMNKIGRAHV